MARAHGSSGTAGRVALHESQSDLEFRQPNPGGTARQVPFWRARAWPQLCLTDLSVLGLVRGALLVSALLWCLILSVL